MDLHSVKRQIKETRPTNNNPLYKSHLYWSQKPYNIADILINNLTKEGEVVFDPFMGSGVTLLEAIQYNRKAIGVEINDLPIFIVDTLLKIGRYDDFDSLIDDFEHFIETLRSYYHTWSNFHNDYGEVKKVIFDRESPFSAPEIKEIHYTISGIKETQKKEPDLFDYECMTKANEHLFINDVNMVPNSRLAVQEKQSTSTLFTARTLNIVDAILEYVSQLESNNQQDIIKYILMSSLHIIKITDLKSNSQWPLWTPKKNCLEKNVIDVIKRRISLVKQTHGFINDNFPKHLNKASDFKELKNSSNYFILKKGAQKLLEDDIPDNSIDLIITDPPYLGQVLYSEYMQLYYPFLGLGFNLEDEIVVSTGQDRDKDENTYFQLLSESIGKISGKLKKGKLMCMYFHDSNLNVWNNLINIMKENGLYFVSQVHVNKKVTLKNILSPKKSLQGDSILFFTKENKRSSSYEAAEQLDEIVQNVVLHVKGELRLKGPMTTTQLLDDGLMEYIIQNNWLDPLSKKYRSIIDVFESYVTWDNKSGQWTI